MCFVLTSAILLPSPEVEGEEGSGDMELLVSLDTSNLLTSSTTMISVYTLSLSTYETSGLLMPDSSVVASATSAG